MAKRPSFLLCSLMVAALSWHCSGNTTVPPLLPDATVAQDSGTLAPDGGTEPQMDAGLPDTGSKDLGSQSCDLEARATALRQALEQTQTDTDFTLLLTRNDGAEFSHSIGSSSAQTTYQSASTSKWVTAMAILRLVDQGKLSLEDHPQKYLSFWTSEAANPLSKVTLAHLLSFTSGLETEPSCTNQRRITLEACAETIYQENLAQSPTEEPGTTYYYSSTHMQIAGLMAIKAGGYNTWSELFADFKRDTGLFENGSYGLPSQSNPRLAGGMFWQGSEYLEFLEHIYQEKLLSASLHQTILRDYTASAQIKYSPAAMGVNEDWHYGLGYWIECRASPFNCPDITRISSPGAYGAYPFIDYTKKYWGILARQGRLGSFRNGLNFFYAVQPAIEAWVDCRP